MSIKDFIRNKLYSFFGLSNIKLQNNLIIKNNFEILYSIKKKSNEKDANFYEQKAFSQFGEDGIIRYLIDKIKVSKKIFVEFGVENYEESNTRLLLENNWSGLVIEASKKYCKHIESQDYYWRQNLKCVNQFVTKDNINLILNDNNFSGSIGLLSIDIDGNDYWIWKAINQIDPDIVVIEFNPRFKNHSITIPYDPEFVRGKNFSKIYYGASLLALNKLGSSKGYKLICTNQNANNVFFVKEKLINDNIITKNVEVCFQDKSFNEIEGDEGFDIAQYPFEEI